MKWILWIALFFAVPVSAVTILREDTFDRERESGVKEYLKEKREIEEKEELARKRYVLEKKKHPLSDASADEHEEHALERLEKEQQVQKNYAARMEEHKRRMRLYQMRDLEALGLLDQRGRNPIDKRNLLGKKGEVSQGAAPAPAATTGAFPNGSSPVAGGIPGAPNLNGDAGGTLPQVPPAYDADSSQQNPDAYPYNPNDPSYIPPPPIDEYPPPYFEDDY